MTDLLIPIKVPLLLDDYWRFLDKVERGSQLDCWPWTGPTTNGYGRFWLIDRNYSSHRVAYAIEFGDPGQLMVLHACNFPSCCNPAHLVAGTQAENIQQMIVQARRPLRYYSRQFWDSDILAIRQAVLTTSSEELAKKYRCNRKTIQNIASRRTWGHIQ